MPLAAGTRIGPYQIISFIAAGGMGEVYKATDTRLNRLVAIKTVATTTRPGSDGVRRLEQEARAAAALNHPNILAVYDVGTVGDMPYIVSELLDGQSLRQCVDGRALAARKAIEYAIEIARGLAAAHTAGIVHRDLKPENVFVTADGRIKILDFGLAKLLPAVAAATPADMTVVREDTAPGLLLGTVAYMSPEQVRGQPADARSDLFALGAILYELMTGRRAFAQSTPADTITAILTVDPPDLRDGDPQVTTRLNRIVRHCLEKVPEQRFQSARDLAFNLEALIESPADAGASHSPRRRASLPLWALPAALVAGGLLTWGALALVPRPAPRVPHYQQITFRKGAVLAARFAGDGRTIVYGAGFAGGPLDLYAIQPGSVESRPIGLPGADLLAAGSPGDLAVSLRRIHRDGFTFTGTLARVPIGGGGARELLDDVQYADWAPDGSALAIVREVAGHTRIEYPIGNVLYQTAGWISDMRVSPRGDLVAFIDHQFRRDDAGSIAVVDREGHVNVLAPGWLSALGLAWSGDEVWFTASKEGSNRALYAVAPGGAVRPLVGSPGLITLRDVGRDGRALITRDTMRVSIDALVPGAAGEHELSWLDWSRLRDLTADGRMILFDETGQGGGAQQGVYIRSIDGSPAVRLGDGTAEAFSPDGRWAISFSVDRSRMILLPTGAGESRAVSIAPLERLHRAFWFPDGKRLLIAANERGRAARLWVLDLAGGAPRAISPEGTSVDAAISPDGRWVATRLTGALTLLPVAGGATRPVAGANPNELIARWTPDATGLYVYDPSRMPVPLVRLDVATGQREPVREIAASNASPLFGVQYLFLTPDVKEYAYSSLHQDSELYVVDGLGNRK